MTLDHTRCRLSGQLDVRGVEMIVGDYVATGPIVRQRLLFEHLLVVRHYGSPGRGIPLHPRHAGVKDPRRSRAIKEVPARCVYVGFRFRQRSNAQDGQSSVLQR